MFIVHFYKLFSSIQVYITHYILLSYCYFILTKSPIYSPLTLVSKLKKLLTSYYRYSVILSINLLFIIYKGSHCYQQPFLLLVKEGVTSESSNLYILYLLKYKNKLPIYISLPDLDYSSYLDRVTTKENI
jgi:hypothetical protein